MSNLPNEAERVIDLLGGTVKTAEICEVSKSAVSQWRNNGIPKPQLRFIKLKRPDLFPKAAKPKRTPQVTPP